MKTFELKGQLRSDIGTKSARHLRREDQVPCVLYGGEQALHFSVDDRDVKDLVYTPHVYFVQIEVDGNISKAVLKDLQFHPVTDRLIHLDFQQVFEDKAVRMAVPVEITGNSIGVRNGGKLVVNTRKLMVSALPKDMPDAVAIDISKLEIGDSFRIRDIKDEHVEFLENPAIVVAAVRMTRSARSAQAASTDA
jgi:large subunit ribosomal protein L25